jgi:hypothetical protein
MLNPKSTILDQVLDLLEIDGRRHLRGLGSTPDDDLLAKMRDRIIEFRMHGVGFSSPEDLREGFDWGEDWIAEHPDEWVSYER